MIRTMNLRGPLRAGLLFGALLILIPSAASAYTISLTGGSSGGNPGGQPLYQVSGLVQGDSFNVAWGGVSGLNVTGIVSVTSLSASAASLQVMLNNMNTPISGNDPRVTAVGLEIDGFTSLATTAAGGTYLTLADDSNFPGYTTDACATSGSNCAGGGSGGIPAGSSDGVMLAVNGTFGGTLKLANFALKVQGGPGGNSFELAGVPTSKVPEPATVGMMAAGAFLFLLRGRGALKR
jgi:hypothetical protein